MAILEPFDDSEHIKVYRQNSLSTYKATVLGSIWSIAGSLVNMHSDIVDPAW